MHTAQWCNHRAKGVLLPWPWLPWEEPGYYPTSHANRWKRQHMAWLYTLFRSPWRRGGGRNTRKVSSFKHRNASLGFAFVNWSIPVADFCGTPRRQKLTLSLGWTCLRSRGSPRRRWELENKDDYNQSHDIVSTGEPADDSSTNTGQLYQGKSYHQADNEPSGQQLFGRKDKWQLNICQGAPWNHKHGFVFGHKPLPPVEAIFCWTKCEHGQRRSRLFGQYSRFSVN